MGLRRQFLPPQIQPLKPEMVVAGFAMPVHEIDTATPDKPFGLMFEALDSLKQDEIYLAAGGSMTYAFWGEMMTTVAMNKGAAGVVLHGYIRDTLKVMALGLPVFSCGSYAQDQRGRGRVIAYREPIRIGDVLVNPGDILGGDVDGVICVPAAAADECVRRALGKVATEARVLDDLGKGLDSSAAFKKYGVM
ncbi:MAG: RraA family protein [Alphaproteobacteria bacterium]|nr:RraA family protein [Alphaproteobacteria bacterium]